MIILVLVLHLATYFGGSFHAVLSFETMEQCRTLTKQLKAYSIRHEIVRDCEASTTKVQDEEILTSR